MISEEFEKITGFEFFDRPINCLEDRVLRKDRIFLRLADLFFEDRNAFKKLESRLDSWIKKDRSERILALAGYVYYILEDYDRAAQFFLEAISVSPENIDTWMDLAFSLYHKEEPLGYAILFNYDLFITLYRKKGYKTCTMESIQSIDSEVRKRGLELAQDFHRFLGKESS